MMKFLRWLAINLAVFAALVLLLEGLAGFVIAARSITPPDAVKSHGPVAESLHTEYDLLLGWVNLPNVAISNMYGPGRDLRINAQRFRDDHDLVLDAPAAGPRMVISGDSFTFGYGVGNADTWGALLEDMVAGLDVVNMGQGGYGLGQAYLWYARDGDALPHDLHIMAFITEDYLRMARDRFMGYGKPVLTMRDDRLCVENIPPPRRRSGEEPWARFTPALAQLRMFDWIAWRAEKRQELRSEHWRARTQPTVARMFAELHRLHAVAGRLSVLVHLPVEDDYRGDDADIWSDWLREESVRNGWVFIDLVEDFRRLPKQQVPAMFIRTDEGRYRGAKGHYTERGNLLVAQALHRHLTENPEIAARLGL